MRSQYHLVLEFLFSISGFCVFLVVAFVVNSGDRCCRKLVAQLARVGTAEQQAACRARLDELEPPIRYCTYQLGKAGSAAAGAGAAEPNSPATAALQAQSLPVCHPRFLTIHNRQI